MSLATEDNRVEPITSDAVALRLTPADGIIEGKPDRNDMTRQTEVEICKRGSTFGRFQFTICSVLAVSLSRRESGSYFKVRKVVPLFPTMLSIHQL